MKTSLPAVFTELLSASSEGAIEELIDNVEATSVSWAPLGGSENNFGVI